MMYSKITFKITKIKFTPKANTFTARGYASNWTLDPSQITTIIPKLVPQPCCNFKLNQSHQWLKRVSILGKSGRWAIDTTTLKHLLLSFNDEDSLKGYLTLPFLSL